MANIRRKYKMRTGIAPVASRENERKGRENEGKTRENEARVFPPSSSRRALVTGWVVDGG
jgi:hypothetical protein